MKDNKSHDKLKPTPNITNLVTGGALEEAYAWVLEQRKDHSANNSIWRLRHHWATIKPTLLESLLNGEHLLSPVQSIRINGEYLSHWDACDALVLKALANTLQSIFTEEDARYCTHLKGGGGIHEAVRQIKMHPDKTFLGCIKKGFDFLGVHFGETPKISRSSVENHQTRLGLRYAQNQSPALIGRYRARWTSRCAELLKSCLDSSNNRSGDKTLVTSRCKELLKDDYYEHLQMCFESGLVG